MKRSWRIPALALLAVIALAGCAPLANELVNTAPVDGQIAGFWQGLWHGLITPFAFIVSLFSGNVGIYEAHNNGGWYNFGFLIGASIMLGGGFGGGGSAARTRRRRTRRY